MLALENDRSAQESTGRVVPGGKASATGAASDMGDAQSQSSIAAAVRFDLPERAADAATARQIVAEQFARADRLRFDNPGAGWPSKLLPARRAVCRRGPAFGCGAPAAVAGCVGRRGGAGLGRRNRPTRRRLCAVAPATSLCELAALARRARLFVSSDTGPLHLAAAVGTPCIGLFGPMPAERNGPYGAGNIAVQEICLSGSSRERRRADNASMRAISVERVATACDQILSRPAERQCA